MSTHFDAIVIGSGQSGTPLSGALVKAGRKTALIESTHIGGCCVNEGCTPTKTMIASGRAAHQVRRSSDYGIHCRGGGMIDTDMAYVRHRKRAIVESFRGGSERRAKASGVHLLEGLASFRECKTLSVTLNNGKDMIVTADEIFINTGERPSKPEIPGIEHIPIESVLNSTSIMELKEVPPTLVVIGGGYIGVEFGQLFARLGSKVQIIQRGQQLLPREDSDVIRVFHQIFLDENIDVILGSTPVDVNWDPNRETRDQINVRCERKSGISFDIGGSHILYAAGRTPNTDILNLEAAGIKTTSKGHVVVNERLETNVPGVYAIGDVKGGPAFTHISYDDFRILQANLIEKTQTRTTEDRIVPYVVYSDPQLGHVGLHEAEAREKYPNRKIQTATMPMEYVARAIETDEQKGIMKAVVDAETGQILGFTCLGLEGGEVMSIVQTAMIGGVPYQKLRDAPYAHPTLAESLNNIWTYLTE